MDATRSDRVTSLPFAISFSPFQNASSRLTLVLWPAITIERLTTGDFIDGPLFRPGEIGDRSEEHTSELQSLTNLVCRLLLEKKKIMNQICSQVHPSRSDLLLYGCHNKSPHT